MAADDPPVITGAVAGQTTTDEATLTPLSGVSVNDVDFGQTETVTVTLSSLPTARCRTSTAAASAAALAFTASPAPTASSPRRWTHWYSRPPPTRWRRAIPSPPLTAGTPAAATAALRAVVFTPAVFTLAPCTSAVTDTTRRSATASVRQRPTRPLRWPSSPVSQPVPDRYPTWCHPGRTPAGGRHRADDLRQAPAHPVDRPPHPRLPSPHLTGAGEADPHRPARLRRTGRNGLCCCRPIIPSSLRTC